MEEKFYQNEVLLEIAMSIGISLDTATMLNKCMPIFMRRLGCVAINMYEDGDDGFRPIFALPKCAAGRDLFDVPDPGQLESAVHSALHTEAEGLHCYTWRLTGFGLLQLVRGKTFSNFMLNELTPMADKLSVALHACRQHAMLQEEKELAHLTLRSIGDGVICTNTAGLITRINEVAEALTGWSETDALGRELQEVFHVVDETTREPTVSLMARGMQNGQICQPANHMRLIARDGREFIIESSATHIMGQTGNILGMVHVFRDITERKQAEEHIHQLAFYDPLTQLPNRRLLLDRLAQGVAASARSERFGALLFIDLDNFKTLNDTIGHDVGDMLLIEVAKRLRDATREADTVARLGGDEFVVMLENLGDDRRRVTLDVEAVANKFLETLNRSYVLNKRHHHSTPSIGVTLFQGDVISVDELLKHADIAMYRAKAAGRNAVRFFEPAMQTYLEQRAALEADLRLALSQHQFLLYYQPQFDVERRIVGVEALVRWRHPILGMVSPVEFIPLAEEVGLILPLGQWVLETACRYLYQWQQQAHSRSLSMAVNISARQFRHPDFVALMREVIDSSGINPAGLKLEITESMMLEEVNDTILKMTELKRIGVSFSIDDFGTGYSSLSYLKRLPLDQIKIDKSFVRDVVDDGNDAVIVRAIIAIADSLGFATIAEGVETEAQRQCLSEQGCYHYQGYLFSQPLPGNELDALLEQQAAVCLHHAYPVDTPTYDI